MKENAVRFAVLFLFTTIAVSAALTGAGREDRIQEISFKNQVLPLLDRYCLPCHAEESDNRSELSLDNYTLLMKGGKHGAAVVPGKPEESTLIQKLDEKPPFGDRMPLARRRRSPESVKKLTGEEITILTEWIRQGARED